MPISTQSGQECAGNSSRDAAIMGSLKEKLKEILGYFDTTKRVVFYDYPLHLNVGDLLIQAGTEKFFADNNIHIWKRYSVYDMPASIRGMDKDVVIICQGGGNLGDLWPLFQNGRERVLELYPHNPIIVLPQTVHFESQERSHYSMTKFQAHGNCHVFARDLHSLKILQRGGVDRSSAMPDMAHALWGCLKARELLRQTEASMRFIRTDKEFMPSNILQGDDCAGRGCDWKNIVSLSTSRAERAITKAIITQSRLGLRTQKYWQWHPVQNRAIGDGVRFFSKYSQIYTNRLHAMILGLLLERKVCAFDNSYGKLSSYRESWLSEMECLQWEPKE
jgi:pyruvyl transferase EpsO